MVSEPKPMPEPVRVRRRPWQDAADVVVLARNSYYSEFLPSLLLGFSFLSPRGEKQNWMGKEIELVRYYG
jgi:hypothetical protein